MIAHVAFFKDDTQNLNVIIELINSTTRFITIQNEEFGRPLALISGDGNTMEDKNVLAHMVGLFLSKIHEFYLILPKPTYYIRGRELNSKEKDVLLYVYKKLQTNTAVWAKDLSEVLESLDFVIKHKESE
mgnify:CR=1 FL=1